MSLLNTLAHAYATGISEAKVIARFMEGKMLPFLKTTEANAPVIETITGLVSPQLANIERAGEALLGIVIQAMEDGTNAATNNGMNIALDAAVVADIKAIMPAVKAMSVKQVATVQAITATK